MISKKEKAGAYLAWKMVGVMGRNRQDSIEKMYDYMTPTSWQILAEVGGARKENGEWRLLGGRIAPMFEAILMKFIDYTQSIELWDKYVSDEVRAIY